MAVLRTRLLLPEEGIASKVIKRGEDALLLVKSNEAGSLGGATAPPKIDGGRPDRITLRFASPVREGQYPQGGARQSAPTLGPRGPAFAMSWTPMVYPPGSNIPQATARNARPSPRQHHASSAARSAATPHQLRDRQYQHRAEQTTQVARPDALPGRHVGFKCCTAGRPYNHPYKASAWTVCENCKWMGHTQRIRLGMKVRAGGDARLEVISGGRFGLTREAGFRVSCCLVGVCILWE